MLGLRGEMLASLRLGTTAASLALTPFIGVAHASTELVMNGGFEQTAMPGSAEFGSRYPSQQVIGWATDGYNFVFNAGTADTTGAQGEYGGLSLWGPGNGSNNGLPASSPAGGNFVAADGAYVVEPISQTISGLTPGEAVDVSFYWAGAQQAGYTGATTEQWKVSLGSQSQYTAVVDNASHGFTGWMHETFAFVPDSASEVLAFMALGTPNGEPPFSLLDGVSVTAMPEPATWTMMGVGLLGMIGIARMRRRSR